MIQKYQLLSSRVNKKDLSPVSWDTLVTLTAGKMVDYSSSRSNPGREREGIEYEEPVVQGRA
jgi:hypothetical protein